MTRSYEDYAAKFQYVAEQIYYTLINEESNCQTNLCDFHICVSLNHLKQAPSATLKEQKAKSKEQKSKKAKPPSKL